MDSSILETILKSLPELGVGITAVISIVFIVVRLSDTHQKERQRTEDAFRSYVESNNHKVTGLVVESTLAIKESALLIREATKSMTENNMLMKDVRDELIRGMKKGRK